jgi:hypothetical protein
MDGLQQLMLFARAAALAISDWILGFRMRRRVKRALDIEASELELTLLSTWIRVEEAEESHRGGKLS